MLWVLLGYSTDTRGEGGVRHREYTTSERKAERFARIPRLDFTDSGHGIVFVAEPHRGPRKPIRRMDYVREHMR